LILAVVSYGCIGSSCSATQSFAKKGNRKLMEGAVLIGLRLSLGCGTCVVVSHIAKREAILSEGHPGDP